MEKREFLENLHEFRQQIEQIKSILDQKDVFNQFAKNTEQINNDQFWQNPDRNGILEKQSTLKTMVEKYHFAANLVEETIELAEFVNSGQEQSDALFAVKKSISNARIEILMSDKFDSGNCFATITPGAGGTESQDWAQMLLRMIMRYCEKNGFTTNSLDIQKGQEAGIKSATILIKGKFSYGKLKSENGVHRLVRISPYDANSRRHTSFASISITPDVEIEKIDIKPEDIKIETFRAGGAGGQHVNTTDSAVRITHLKTGIVASCQNERSQGQNKQFALKILYSRLIAKQEADIKEAQSKVEKKKIEWGSQIRSYVLHPYKLVKDHRTDLESQLPEEVLDGQLDEFIEIFLEKQALGEV